MIDCATVHQRSSDSLKLGVKGTVVIRSCIFQPWMVKEYSRENVGTVARYKVSSPISARSAKGNCTEDAKMVRIGGNKNNGSSNKTCNFCSFNWHKKTRCFKKFPKKAPAWYKEKSVKTESTSSNVEVLSVSFDPKTLGINKLLIQA